MVQSADLADRLKAFLFQVKLQCDDPKCKGQHEGTVDGQVVAAEALGLLEEIQMKAQLLEWSNHDLSAFYLALMYVAGTILKIRLLNYEELKKQLAEFEILWTKLDREYEVREDISKTVARLGKFLEA